MEMKLNSPLTDHLDLFTCCTMSHGISVYLDTHVHTHPASITLTLLYLAC